MTVLYPHIHDNDKATPVRDGGLWLMNNRYRVSKVIIHNHAPCPDAPLQPECMMVAVLDGGAKHYISSCNDRAHVVSWCRNLFGEENVFDLK